MSSSVDLVSEVEHFPIALTELPLELADGKASRLIFFGVGVCLDSISSDQALFCPLVFPFSSLSVSRVETSTPSSPVSIASPPSSNKFNTTITLVSQARVPVLGNYQRHMHDRVLVLFRSRF